MRKIVFLLGFVCCISCVYAQADYRPGYVITLSNDTIRGKIDYQGDKTMGSVCRFQSPDQMKANYYPNEIRGYRFTDGKCFVSREVNGQKWFLEFLIKGKMNVYYLRNEEGDHYYIEKEDKPLVKIPYTDDMRSKDGKDFHYRSTLHYGLLNLYTEDVPALNNEIKKINTPSHKNLIKLAKDYHNRVSKDEEYIVFEQSKPSATLRIEPAVGMYHVFSHENMPGNDVISYGVWIYAGMPRANEKLYFKTGAFFSRQYGYQWNRIPIQIEYLYPKGILRPTIAAGTTLYWDEEGVALIPNYSVGLKILPKNTKFRFSVNYELETIHDKFETTVWFFIPGTTLLGQHLSAGVSYSF